MKTLTKVVLVITAVAVWISCMCIFVPYDMKTVELADDAPNKFFNTENNYLLDDIMSERFENYEQILTSLQGKSYKCLSAEESYEMLMSEGNDSMQGYLISDNLMGVSCHIDGDSVPHVVFFENDGRSFVLFTVLQDAKDRFRLLDYSYAIFSVDSFDKELTEHFVTSASLIRKPSSNTATEAMFQSGVITTVYIVVFSIIALTVSTVRYKKSKRGQKLTNDDTTTDKDIKKYIKNKLGADFFSDEMITVQPCITVDAKGEKAVSFISAIAEKYNINEIFIGSFFEEKNYIDTESTNAIYIKEYLDENSYSSIKYPENKAVIEWIVSGNNTEETSISFYMQELNFLIYPLRDMIYIFCQNSNETFEKLIDVANDNGLKIAISN